MALGSLNQTNRLGHGVASNEGIAAGQLLIAAGVERTLEYVMNSIFSGSSVTAFAPFEVRLQGSGAD